MLLLADDGEYSFANAEGPQYFESLAEHLNWDQLNLCF